MEFTKDEVFQKAFQTGSYLLFSEPHFQVQFLPPSCLYFSSTPLPPPHRLHGQDGGNNVVGVVLPSRHAHQAVPGAADKDQAARAQEAQQPGPHKVRLARHKLPVLSLWPHLGVKYCS